MAKPPKDKPVYAFIRRGEALVPEMEWDRRALEGIGQGQRVRIEVKEFRNVARHRSYWAMLGEASSLHHLRVQFPFSSFSQCCYTKVVWFAADFQYFVAFVQLLRFPGRSTDCEWTQIQITFLFLN